MLFVASVAVLLSFESFRSGLETLFAYGSIEAVGIIMPTFFAITLVGGLLFLFRVLAIGKDLPSGAKLPPVVQTGWPIVGPLLAFINDPLVAVTNARKIYGNIFTINMLHIKSTFLIGCEAHKAFFEAMDCELDQAPCYKFMIPVFGEGVVYDAPITKRRQQMRFLGSALRPTELRLYPAIVAQETALFFKEHFPNAGANECVDLHGTMADLTILTASATLHGPEVRKHLYKEVSQLFAGLDKGISPLSILFPYAPTPAHRARDIAHRGMVDLFTKVIEERRAKQATEGPETKKGVDMLQKLMDSSYKDGTPVPDNEIAGLLISVLFAGQHTSSITLTWTLLFLLDDEQNGGHWLRKIKEELKSLEPRPGAFARGDVTHDEVSKMDTLHACIKETLRLYPPLIFLMRQVVNQPFKVCEFTVPVGYNVWVSNALAGRAPDVWKEPNKFDPGRWMDFDIRRLRPYTFIGFGAGIHTCMGESFAFMQLRTILAVVLSTFELEMLGVFPAANYEAMVVMPKGPNMIRFTRKLPATDCAGVEDPGISFREPGISTNNAGKRTTQIGLSSMNEEVSTKFTKREVAKHNRRDDLWIIVQGKVYDVTTYLPVHQGGDAILKYAGKDATAGVYGEQHPSAVTNLLERYLIGTVS